MRARLLLTVSLGLNLAFGLALVFLNRPVDKRPIAMSLVTTNPITSAPPVLKTNVVVRRQYFTWRELESTNYSVYIGNLRSIGCPESTIRDIIVAEVNTLFERRRSTEVVPPEHQWWRSEPSPEMVQAAQNKVLELEEDRRELLTELLGPNWEINTHPRIAAVNTSLDGPILGTLSPTAKSQIREVEAAIWQKTQDFIKTQTEAGHTMTSADAARLRAEARTELAKVMSPEQLEEYLLRYSDGAHTLRNQFRGFDISPEEFRKIFEQQQAIDQQSALFASDSTAASASRQAEYDKQKEAIVKDALGPDQYQLFKLNQDPLFRQTQASAERVGAPAEAVLPIYQINQASVEETRRIQNDPTLTTEERAAALQNIAAQRRESLQKLLGDRANRFDNAEPTQ